MSERPIIHSYGGGTQSIAIVCLCLQGRLPMPERFVIADTSREATETWEYLDRHIQPLLAKVGKRVEIAPHSLARAIAPSASSSLKGGSRRKGKAASPPH